MLIEKELKAFSQVLTSPQRPLVAIVGGAKINDKCGPRAVLEAFHEENGRKTGLESRFSSIFHSV